MTPAYELPAALIERLRATRSVGAITGAGVSAESGIRTYRGKGGLYDDPAEGDATVEALSGRTLATDPDRTWLAVSLLARQAVGARPNPAHLAIAAIERTVERFVLLTQNVDELHQLAGSRNVIDIHGSIHHAICSACSSRHRLSTETLTALRQAPRCPRCGGMLRPDAVLFGELLPAERVRRIRQEFYETVPDLVLAAGTSALFPYISEPVALARRAGRLTVEVNPEPTCLSEGVDFSLRCTAARAMPSIARALGAEDH
jgi:NAD-dependent deacetylase